MHTRLASRSCWLAIALLFAACSGSNGHPVAPPFPPIVALGAAGTPARTPRCSCEGKACGDDGCGESCGTCEKGLRCGPDGACECVVDCSSKECGDDGCGGICGNGCSVGQSCLKGRCACEPRCEDRQCGDDGCSGSCGDCSRGERCNNLGQCVCVPDCSGRSCGGDGCGGACGTCAVNDACDAFGHCECAADAACPPGEVCAAGVCCQLTLCQPGNCGQQISDGCGGVMDCPTCACATDTDCPSTQVCQFAVCSCNIADDACSTDCPECGPARTCSLDRCIACTAGTLECPAE